VNLPRESETSCSGRGQAGALTAYTASRIGRSRSWHGWRTERAWSGREAARQATQCGPGRRQCGPDQVVCAIASVNEPRLFGECGGRSATLASASA